ncbi:MAG: MBL fold metallo-hydrolase [Paludibacteraceae bacterium]|nr:MBL fold metallo-hydrolase [Paludibacteraceae bacterium]
MKITIHRGNQIGGCITTIEHDGCKIIIDLGSNLPGSKEKELTKEDIDSITSGANAILYTHYHGDHTGLHHLIDPNIPQFIGAGAKEVMLCKYNALNAHNDYSAQIKSTKDMRPYKVSEPIEFKGCDKIKVTPYLVSHSAFDAYMFKIECDNIKILHTGDFRQHGYIGKRLFDVLKIYIKDVDILITEGTMLGRSQETVLHENDIKSNTIAVLKEHKYVFALCSSTDIDRLASFHDACKQIGRTFFVDEYQQEVLNVFSKYSGKHSNLFKFDKTFKLIDFGAPKVVTVLKSTGFLMPIRSSMLPTVKSMMSVYNDENPWLIYSMWSGYAEEGKSYTNNDILKIRQLFNNNILDGTKDGFHTSGHADIATLEEVCKIVNPKIGVIPIHKDKNTKYDMSGVSNYKIFTSSEKVSDNLDIIFLNSQGKGAKL